MRIVYIFFTTTLYSQILALFHLFIIAWRPRQISNIMGIGSFAI